MVAALASAVAMAKKRALTEETSEFRAEPSSPKAATGVLASEVAGALTAETLKSLSEL